MIWRAEHHTAHVDMRTRTERELSIRRESDGTGGHGDGAIDVQVPAGKQQRTAKLRSPARARATGTADREISGAAHAHLGPGFNHDPTSGDLQVTGSAQVRDTTRPPRIAGVQSE